MQCLIAILSLVLALQPAEDTPWDDLPSGYQRQFKLQVENFIRLPDGRIFDRQNENAFAAVKEKHKARPSDAELRRQQVLGPTVRFEDNRATRRWGLSPAEGYESEPPPLWWAPEEEIVVPIEIARLKVIQVLEVGSALIDASVRTSWVGPGFSSSGSSTEFRVSFGAGLSENIVDAASLEGPFYRLPWTEKTYQYESALGPRTIPAWSYIRVDDVEVLSEQEIYEAYLDGKIEFSDWRCQERRERREDKRITVYEWVRVAKTVHLPRVRPTADE